VKVAACASAAVVAVEVPDADEGRGVIIGVGKMEEAPPLAVGDHILEDFVKVEEFRFVEEEEEEEEERKGLGGLGGRTPNRRESFVSTEMALVGGGEEEEEEEEDNSPPPPRLAARARRAAVRSAAAPSPPRRLTEKEPKEPPWISLGLLLGGFTTIEL